MRLRESLTAVGSDRFQQAVAPGVGHHQRLINQLRHRLKHGVAVEAAVRANRGDSLEGEAAGKHGQPPEDDSLSLGKELVTPVHGRSQGSQSGGGGAATSGEQGEALLQVLKDFIERHERNAGRGQLNREGDEIKVLANPAHDVEVVVSELKSRVVRPGPVGEQAKRFVATQGWNPPGQLAGHFQWLSTRRQHAEVLASLQKFRR